jgi:Arc/MetJ-type ribon-helix-helix transcriptional regulator
VKKPQFTIRLPKECADWLEKKVRTRVFANPSHGVEVCIRNEMKKEGLIKDE